MAQGTGAGQNGQTGERVVSLFSWAHPSHPWAWKTQGRQWHPFMEWTICTLKTTDHGWKKLKKVQVLGTTHHVHRLDGLMLSTFLCYWKWCTHYTATTQKTSCHFLRLGKENPKIHVEPQRIKRWSWQQRTTMETSQFPDSKHTAKPQQQKHLPLASKQEDRPMIHKRRT